MNEYEIKSHRERISLFKEFLKENGDLLKEFKSKYYVSRNIFRYSEKDQDEVYLESDLGNHQTPYAYVGLSDSPYIVFYTHVANKDSKEKKQKKERLRLKAIQLLKEFISIHPEYEIYNRLKRNYIEHSETNYNELENWTIHPPKIEDRRGLMESLKLLMQLFYNYLAQDATKIKNEFSCNNMTNNPPNFFPRSLFLAQGKPIESVCSKVIIVGPYPTSGFVKTVISELNPKIVYVVVDESWKPTELEEIGNIKSVQLIRVRTENGVGIVHAKMYYVEYEKDSKYYTRLFFGSINASQNSVVNNSEFWVSFRLAAFKKNDREKIKKYFNDLVSETSTIVKSRKIELRNRKKQIISILSFPQITKADKIKSFYNWLRSGSFFVKYEPDSTFGCLTVKLNKERLPKEKLNELLKGSIFENATLKQELRYSYVGDNDVKPGIEKWKKFTVDTRNGLWLSYERLANGKDFPPVILQKSRIIEKLKKYDDKKINDKIKYFINEVKKLRANNELKKIICIPNESKLKKKIDNDIALANNMEFKNRYETGYATINISTNNSEYLEAIADDFIESCAIKNTKSRVENRMAQIFRNLFEGLSTKEIHRELLTNWNDYKDDLVNYYKQEKSD